MRPSCYNEDISKGDTPMNVPNWKHNSGKDKKTKGMCKAQLKARRQALKALKANLNVK